MQNRKHQEHCAQQEFVGNRIEVLTKRGLLFQGTREQAIEGITESCQYEQSQRPGIMTANKINDDKRQKRHAQQGQLVRRTEQLLHGCGLERA